jgi:hypothetical protein
MRQRERIFATRDQTRVIPGTDFDYTRAIHRRDLFIAQKSVARDELTVTSRQPSMTLMIAANDIVVNRLNTLHAPLCQRTP